MFRAARIGFRSKLRCIWACGSVFFEGTLLGVGFERDLLLATDSLSTRFPGPAKSGFQCHKARRSAIVNTLIAFSRWGFTELV